ncbi:MAG: hypothetical protein ABEJ40_10615 [Haloarculaceae archaeon]
MDADGLLGRVVDRLTGREGRAWAGSVEDLLFEGESVRRRVSLGGNRVVVTTHRLLAFTPDADGENYRTVDLPNVTDVRAGHEGETNLLWQAGRLFVYAGLLLAVGFLFDFGTIVPTDAFSGTGAATGRLGLGSLVGMMRRLLSLIALIDDVARLLGALLVLLGTFVVGVYLLTRERVLVVGVAGDEADDIHVPLGEEGDAIDLDDAVAALERSLFERGPGGPTGDGRTSSGAGSVPSGADAESSAPGGNAGTEPPDAGRGSDGHDGDGSAADAGFKSDDPL